MQAPPADRLADPEGAKLVAAAESRTGPRQARGRERRAGELRDVGLEWRERRIQQLDVVVLQGHVVAIGDLALQRRAGLLQLRVE